MKANRPKDLATLRTHAGIHRDDLEFFLKDQLFKSIASQGQRKSLLFALKLAQLQLLQEKKNFTPLLLLDDVFEKLDSERTANLIRRVCDNAEGQVFITDTSTKRLADHLQKFAAQIIEL
jgi:DNA replication and repair protein RecF